MSLYSTGKTLFQADLSTADETHVHTSYNCPKCCRDWSKTHLDAPYSSLPKQSPLVNYHDKCIDRNHDDGILCSWCQQWVQRPCRSKQCPKHWRIKEYKQVLDYERTRPKRKRWHSIRLSCMIRLKKEGQAQHIRMFRQDIKAQVPDAIFVTKLHGSAKHDHYHVLIGTDANISRVQVKEAWQAHFPGKGNIKFSGHHWSMKEHGSPNIWLKYVSYMKEGKLRTTNPSIRCRRARTMERSWKAITNPKASANPDQSDLTMRMGVSLPDLPDSALEGTHYNVLVRETPDHAGHVIDGLS